MQKLDKQIHIVVIGGGASGLMAGIVAAREGLSVLLIDRMPRVGKKILVTGNGRCNLSNRSMSPDHFHGASAAFITGILEQCDLAQTLDFFESIGLAVQLDEQTGRYFPRSSQASSVLDLLRLELARLGVNEMCGTTVTQIDQNPSGFVIETNKVERLGCRCIILATGGKAVPNLGSNGSGYPMAQAFGHNLISPFPALVQLTSETQWIRSLKGIKCEAEVTLKSAQKTLRTESGEIHFTDYGLSGIPALQLAKPVVQALAGQEKLCIEINFFPEWSLSETEEKVHKRFDRFDSVPVGDALISLINKRLIPVILKNTGIQHNTLCRDLSGEQKKLLIQSMTQLPLPISGTRSWSDAQVTAGGIDTSQVDPVSLESRLVPGLFFAGEILDVDGDSGGYNLQWAWSSGWVAGQHAARKYPIK